MSNNASLYETLRKPFSEILETPDEITYVYSLEKHIWEGETEEEITKSRKEGKLRYSTLKEFLIGPVRDYLIDLLDHVRLKEGQGWWVQAEFGSGKSHLLSASTILLLGADTAWEIIEEKERKLKVERRLSLTQFRRPVSKRKIFPVILSLVGKGGPGTPKSLVDYIMDAASTIYEALRDAPLPVYPEEHLADRFLTQDIDMFKGKLKEFLKTERYLEGLPKYTYDELLEGLQETNQRRDAGKVLWKFYRDYLKMEPRIPVDPLERLEGLVRRILEEGYDGVLFVLDEVSEYMQKDEQRRTENEDTLLVLSHTLAKEKNLPVWTLCAAQTTIEMKRGASKIIAPERLKQYELLRREKSYYEIVLKRLRKIKDEENLEMYYQYFKRIVTWPEQRGVDEFKFFFPFYPDAIDVIRTISTRLTTARSALYFLHSGLLRAIEEDRRDILSLWNIFEDIISYEEAPSGGMTGVVSIRTRYPDGYRAYEAAEKSLDGVTKGSMKIYRKRASKLLNTLFLYYLAGRPPLSPEDVLNAVMETKDPASTLKDNLDHYEALLVDMDKELVQIEEKDHRFTFVKEVTEDTRILYKKARDEIAQSPSQFTRYYKKLLGYEGNFFEKVAPDNIIGLDFLFHNQQRRGRVGIKNLSLEGVFLPDLNTVETNDDFMLLASLEPLKDEITAKIIKQKKDPRMVLWIPRSMSADEKEEMTDILAYRKLEEEQEEKRPNVHLWAKGFFEKEAPHAHRIVESTYVEGKMMSIDKTLSPSTEGGLTRTFQNTAVTILDGIYEASKINFEKPFRRADAAMLANALIKSGKVVERSSRNLSAMKNFAFPLGLSTRDAPEILDPSGSEFYARIEGFIEKASQDEIPVRSVYQNFLAGRVGLTRRMVDLYLLAMVQEGKIKLRLKDRKIIDRSNIEQTNFTTSLLNQLERVIKPREPEFWQEIRPFIEILTDEKIAEIYVERAAGEALSKLRRLFAEEKTASNQLAQCVTQFFVEQGRENSYQESLERFKKLFIADVEGDRDIVVENLAKALTAYLGKPVASYSSKDVKGFAECYKKYRGLRTNFDRVKDAVRAALNYSALALPDEDDLMATRSVIKELEEATNSVFPELWDETYTEAKFRPMLQKAISTYFNPYRDAHTSALYISNEIQRTADKSVKSRQWWVVQEFAAETEVAQDLLERSQDALKAILSGRIDCKIRDDNELRSVLRAGPYCRCDFKLEHRATVLRNLKAYKDTLEKLPNTMIQELARFLMSPEARSRLSSSDQEEIQEILRASTPEEMVEHLIKLDEDVLSETAKIVGAILRKSKVQHVSLSEFAPSRKVVSSESVKDVTNEFERFLKSFLVDKDTLLILRSRKKGSTPQTTGS